MICQEFIESDVERLLPLEPEGWGDIRPRYRFFLKSECCKPVKIEVDGELAAVGTTIFHTDTVWFACIITHPAHQGKGLGTALTRYLIESVDRSRYPTIYLDATEFGYPVYLKQGFQVEGQYAHLRRETDTFAATVSPNIVPFREEFRKAAYAVDALASGEDRRGVMAGFLNDSHVYLGADGVVQGVYMPSWSDGPIVAANDEAGLELMRLRCLDKQAAILPMENTAAMQFLEENGYQMRKTSRRMILGPQRVRRPELVYNRISGALG